MKRFEVLVDFITEYYLRIHISADDIY